GKRASRGRRRRREVAPAPTPATRGHACADADALHQALFVATLRRLPIFTAAVSRLIVVDADVVVCRLTATDEYATVSRLVDTAACLLHSVVSFTRMIGSLRHRLNPSTSIAADASAATPASAVTSCAEKAPEKDASWQWEIYPYVKSRKVPTVQGALLKLFYPDMIGPKSHRRVAKTWTDYKWSPNDETMSAAETIKRLRFKCAPDVDLQEADRILDINMTNLVRHMMCVFVRARWNAKKFLATGVWSS
ncbi:hypothetical protein EJB05_44207, partial [Eragrostis curvula]